MARGKCLWQCSAIVLLTKFPHSVLQFLPCVTTNFSLSAAVLLVPVFSWYGCHSIVPQTGNQYNSHSFCHSSGGWKPRVKMPTKILSSMMPLLL